MNPATAFAAVLTDELLRCGLADVVLAPGSRSAPLAMALWDRAAAGDVRLHVRIDERSAAFLALGLAKASGRPVGVVCTSGTPASQNQRTAVPYSLSWSMVWFAPVPRSSAGRSAVSTSSGTADSPASITAG